jgi:alkylhydroperoxidase family enzyme
MPLRPVAARFTALVVRNRGWVSDADTDAFFAVGYTRRNVLEVILGVATKVMSNYTNHIAHTQLDKFMRGNEWVEPDAAGTRALETVV